MASFDFRAVINQKRTHTQTYIDTQDKEEAMLEVAVHGALKPLVTGVFLNVTFNLVLIVTGFPRHKFKTCVLCCNQTSVNFLF